MFKKYDTDIFKKLNNQHNIFVLVGNGFDISVLKKFKQGKMNGKTTSYVDFYDYITYFNLSNDKNVLYKKMKEDRNCGKENWSDFENTICCLLDECVSINALEKCIDEFQGHFTRFLNELVDADTLLNLSGFVSENSLSRQSMSRFLNDLGILDKLEFTNNTYHYDLFYYVFANFNYTSLLDSYLYLDKTQFDPHCHRTVDTHFSFNANTKIFDSTAWWSSYLVYEIIHPHGTQDIPRSILFGIDLPEYDRGGSQEKRLVKSYWSQYDTKYKSYMEEAELFIIYGMSLGRTDAWWMDEIFQSILDRDVELIIYKHGDEDKDSIKKMFIDCCIRHVDCSAETKKKVEDNIHIVTFDDNDTYFLGFKAKE